ncbi:type II secretion system F family protein [Pseudonocardia oroxyli]|uniref:type II secretion system F family protein n=1 Tax=Pseudonocardia oroxyli TaxID=366584 RepID=UPI000A6BE545|nr:type II secretion system F family protein [Pseudonocardia oroxyli]
MSPLLLGALCGGLLGLATALLVTALRPWHPRLDDGLQMLDDELRPTRRVPGQHGGLLRSWTQRIPTGVDAADLTIASTTREEFVLRRLVSTLSYAAAGPALALVLWLVDAELPAVVPATITIAAATAAWTGAARQLRDRADDLRDEMRYALVAYLQQVSLLRRGGAGVATALLQPAGYLESSWAMRRITHHLEIATRSGQMPWYGLGRLAEEIDLPELDDLADTARSAGDDGGAVIDTLLARASSLSDELRADARAEANRASVRLSTPGAMQVFLIAAWVLYPATTTLLTS